MTFTKPYEIEHIVSSLTYEEAEAQRERGKYLLKAIQLAIWSQESRSDPCNSKVMFIATWLTDVIVIKIPSTLLSSAA